MAAAKVSPLAPKNFAELPSIEGVRLAAGTAGIRYEGRTDVMLALFDQPATVAGVFTTSRCPSAPVDWCRDKLRRGRRGRWSSIPATPTPLPARRRARRPSDGETGGQGGRRRRGRNFSRLDRRDRRAARRLEIRRRARPFGAGRPRRKLARRRPRDHDHRHFPKVATRQGTIGGVEVTINGIAKGAGMIAPDMATMLAYVFTDAAIAADALQKLLSRASKERSTRSRWTATPRPPTL